MPLVVRDLVAASSRRAENATALEAAQERGRNLQQLSTDIDDAIQWTELRMYADVAQGTEHANELHGAMIERQPDNPELIQFIDFLVHPDQQTTSAETLRDAVEDIDELPAPPEAARRQVQKLPSFSESSILALTNVLEPQQLLDRNRVLGGRLYDTLLQCMRVFTTKSYQRRKTDRELAAVLEGERKLISIVRRNCLTIPSRHVEGELSLGGALARIEGSSHLGDRAPS
jgi:hypothetical protein